MTQFAQEFTDVVTILQAGYANPERIAYPGEDFDPDPAWAEWLDVEINHGGQGPDGIGGPHELLDFGENTIRVLTLDVAICSLKGNGAAAANRVTADALAAYSWTDTATMIYRPDISHIGRSGEWQDVWYRTDWLMPIWRFDS